MAWPDDIDMSRDHEVWDNVESCLYLQKTEQRPPDTGVNVAGTMWLAIRKDRLPADSILIKFDLTVNLPAANLGGTVPKMDNILVRANGTRWVIKLVEIVALENEYRVRVVRSFK
jgi:hypothetical protein